MIFQNPFSVFGRFYIRLFYIGDCPQSISKPYASVIQPSSCTAGKPANRALYVKKVYVCNIVFIVFNHFFTSIFAPQFGQKFGNHPLIWWLRLVSKAYFLQTEQIPACA